MKWILLISPAESTTNRWEAVVRKTLAGVRAEIKKRDLTKEHYYARADRLADLLRAYWDHREGA